MDNDLLTDSVFSNLTLYLSDSSNDERETEPGGDSRQRKRLQQTEADYLVQKALWKPKDDILFSSARLRLQPRIVAGTVAVAGINLSIADLKSKAEQEYYLRRYRDASASAEEALTRIAAISADTSGAGDEDAAAVRVSEADKKELRALVEKCAARVKIEWATGTRERHEAGIGREL